MHVNGSHVHYKPYKIDLSTENGGAADEIGETMTGKIRFYQEITSKFIVPTFGTRPDRRK